MKRAFARGLGGVLLISLVAACGGEEETAAGDDVSPQQCVTDLVELTDGDISAAALVERCGVSGAEAEAAVPAAATASEPDPTTTTTAEVVVEDTRPVAPTTAPAPEPVAVMPDIACGTDLQLAQDLVQEAGIFFSRSEDATGQDRSQVMDRNWTVVAAEPPAGRPIGEDEAVFYVVKDEEFSGC
jgi:hypothetical protein